MKLKRVNITLTVLISISLILMGIFVFRSSYLRLIETLRDFGTSVKYFFLTLFEVENPTAVTVVERSKVMFFASKNTSALSAAGSGESLSGHFLLPNDFAAFKLRLGQYFSLLFSGENFLGYFNSVGKVLGDISRVLLVLLPCLLVFGLSIKRLYNKPNNNHNRDTIPLKVFKWITGITYYPVKRFLLQYFAFLMQFDWILKLWLFAAVLHLNLGSIIVAFFAFYFYFVMSYDFVSIYTQFVKLFIDLQVFFRTVPLWSFAILAYILFDRWRKKIATGRLHHFEARNCGFINELPIVSMCCGSMGKKKTSMISDMTLSQEVMFRQKAFEILQKSDMKFPYFPWIKFEMEIRTCMEFGVIYNLASIKTWIRKKKERFLKHGNADFQLYGYDVKKYGNTFNDSLSIKDLFDVLETYALAYFMHVIETSLIVSNYSIRTDNVFCDSGNFPLWSYTMLPEKITEGRHSHILDFDVLRLGKKVIEKNPHAGSFEFGVIAISEIGKERGNNLELQTVKKNDEGTNQKNDLFNSWLKMCRHSATVDNYPFIKVFTDEQRAASWGADARDMADILNIVSSGEQKLSMPFYTIEDMISEWAFNRFLRLYTSFRYNRGDNTLLVYLLKSVTAFLWRSNMRIYNRYGYSKLCIEKERGTLDGSSEQRCYYLMNQKIYARRFSTDCFSDFFSDMAKKSNVGLRDYLEYASEKASVDELKQQNSYFINSLYKNTKSKEE